MRILQTGLTYKDDAKATPGFTLFSPLWTKTTYLLNMDGEPVHEWDLPGTPGGYARLLPNGNLFYAAQWDGDDVPPFKGGAQGGIMREVDWDGNVLTEFIDGWQHHDARKLANGNIVYAGWDVMPEDAQKRVRGGRPGTEPPGGIIGDYVREVDPDGNTVWEWHTYEMDIEKYPIHPLVPRRVFAWCNTTFPLENGDVLISLRQINTIAIIDRETKKFRWEFTDMILGGQHDPQMLPNGNVIVFANGMNSYEGHPHSLILEIDPKTNEIVWQYRAQPRTDFYSHHISGQERLWTGNTLICEGRNGRLFEVTPDGELAWEFISPHRGPGIDGDNVNWVFRAFRYAEDSPEIAGRVTL